MTDETIKEAAAEAKRFLKRVDEYGDGTTTSEYWHDNIKRVIKTKDVIGAGALRRSSMDLTRALAKMRRY